MTIGQRISKRRNELGISQEELAKRLNYKDRTTISKMEKVENMGLDRVKKVAEALRTTPSYLMGWEEAENLKEQTNELEIELLSEIRKMDNDQLRNLIAYARFINTNKN